MQVVRAGRGRRRGVDLRGAQTRTVGPACLTEGLLRLPARPLVGVLFSFSRGAFPVGENGPNRGKSAVPLLSVYLRRAEDPKRGAPGPIRGLSVSGAAKNGARAILSIRLAA